MNSAFQVITVSQLLRFVKSVLEDQKPLADLLVAGEVSNLSLHRATGHIYFTLGTEGCTVRCVMFRRYAQALRTLPEEGRLVMVRGSATVYDRDGSVELLAYDIQTMGEGAKAQALDALKTKLSAEGLFDERRKKPFLPYPAAVGIVTSREGAALQDIIRTFSLHNRAVRLLLYHASVQGVSAPDEIIAALDALESDGECACVILARGGGSSEDLSAFNSERLVRRIAACRLPVISAVGHETDVTLCDLAADARAATPSSACRLACRSAEETLTRISSLSGELTLRIQKRLQEIQRRLENASALFSAHAPETILKKNRQNLEYLIKLLSDLQQAHTERLTARLNRAVGLLDGLNPARLLSRGYAITTKNGRAVTDIAVIAPGDMVTTAVCGGFFTSEVIRTERAGDKV